MSRRIAAAVLLFFAMALPGCRDFGVDEKIIDINWVRATGEAIYSTIGVGPNGALYGVPFEGAPRLLRSEDRGENWTTVLTLPDDWEFVAEQIAFSPAGVGYVTVTRENPNHTVGLFRSANGGLDWEPVDFAWVATFHDDMAVSSNGTVFLGTRGSGQQGLHRSADGGQNWTLELASSPVSGGVLRGMLATGPDGMVIARTRTQGDLAIEGTTSRSSDHGQTWETITHEGYTLRTISIDEDGVVFAGGELADRTADVVLRSDDAGESWTRSQQLLPLNTIVRITPHLRNNVYLAAGINGVYRSEDGGATFQQVNEGFIPSDPGEVLHYVNQVLLSPDGYLYANTDRGLYRTRGRAE